MKRTIAVVSLVFFVIAVFAFAADDAKEELRPSQKVMRARQAWLSAISENLSAKNFEAVAKNAGELAVQTNRLGENLPNPLAKDLTLAISSLAREIPAAAEKKDGETINAKLGAIKGKCAECHAKIRDKK